MSNAKKVLILTLTMIFAIAVSATIVSFSFAGGASKDAAPSLATADDDTSSDSTSTLVDTLTNIDHIIDKANDTSLSDDERIFHIVQIVSNGKTNTSLKSYVESGDFATYVINNNRSAGHAEMPLKVNGQDSVQIDVLTIQNLRDMVAATPTDYSRINIADLIYISNDPADPFVGADVSTGDKGNDIPEDIHKLIQPYVSGDYKPLIIDSEGVAGDTSNAYAMSNLVSNVLAANYIKYRTFAWKDTLSLVDFLNRKSGSVYIPLEITVQNYGTSKVLVITGDNGSNTMYNAISGGDDFINNAFYRKGYLPDDVKVDSISYESITDSTFADGYDFVFIENDTYSAMTQTIYNAIAAVSYAKKHVIYSSGLQVESSTSGGTDNESNYKELYTMVVSQEGIAMQSNVYVSSYTFFDAMAADPSGTQEAANAIAALLKASTYREFGVDSASGKKYTVLEIQPAYPIDTELAKENGTYYSSPSNMYTGSKETTPSGSEYYAFEMTMEKVMALTGLDSSQIELVQVSTEELQGMKTSITDQYDLIYVGGNTSAFFSPDEYKVVWGTKISGISNYAYFQMYSHSGTLISLGNFSKAYGAVANGNDYILNSVGGNDLSAANLEGLKSYIDAGMPIVFSDDITKAYTDIANYDNVYENGQIDPDSNMFQLLSYAFEGNTDELTYTFENAPSNVLADFDKDDTIRIANLNGEYGDSSISGSEYVEVFNDGALVPYMIKSASGEWADYDEDTNPDAGDAANTAGGKLKTLINANATRPTMNLTKMPSIYVANSPSSYLDTPVLNFEFELLTNGNTNVQSFTVTLYIDDNSNGLFTDSGENVKTVTVPVGSDGKATGALSYEMSSDFYGPISWKIEAVANFKDGTSTVAGSSVSYSAISKVSRTTQAKELVSILQIIPDSGDQGYQSANSLYFCTECQLAMTVAHYNVWQNGTLSSNGDGTTNYGAIYRAYGSGTVDSLDGEYNIGLHEHKFGIWKYDSDLGYDDWTSNLADTLSGDDGDFEFRIDIYTPEVIDEKNTEYNSNTIAKLQEAYESAKKSGDTDDIEEAKEALETEQTSELAAAELLYEEYENLVTVTDEKEEDLRAVLQYIVDNQSALESSIGSSILDWDVFSNVLEVRNYYDIFSRMYTSFASVDPTASYWGFGMKEFEANDKTYKFGVNSEDYGSTISEDYSLTRYYYQNWANAKSEEVEKLEEYWEAVRAAYGKDWMQEVYGMVIIGASDNFNNQDLSQDVCDTLVDYEKSGGNMLMFHDTMASETSTTNANGNNNTAMNLTNSLRDVFGLNRYHMSASSEDSSKYALDATYDESKYYLSIMATDDDSNDYIKTDLDLGWGKSTFTRTLVGMTTLFAVKNTNAETGNSGVNKVSIGAPYKYATMNTYDMTEYNQDYDNYMTRIQNGTFGSNRAVQLNKGIVTSYPFKVSDKLNVSITHGQYLALDVEDSNVITWYTLAASNTTQSGSSLYAADPGDAADNYFIYTKDNVTYCGAGHSKVTGPYTDNNDERMLFINIICNSARKNALKPSIKIYDPDTKLVVPSAKNKYILQDSGGEPYIEVSSESELIRFGFLATVDTTASETISKVEFFFLESDGTEEYVGTFNDKLTSGKAYYVNSADSSDQKIAESIQLKSSYFEGYDDCAYLYIRVTDSNGETLLEKIRIDLVRDLFDLTENTVEETPIGSTLLDYIKDL